MFLIDKPFVSDFLVQTIRENQLPIISTIVARELIQDDSLAWIPEEEAIKQIKQDSSLPIYSNSENALNWIVQNLGETKLASQVGLFKDKVKFRELIKDSFPDFFFRTIKLEDIQNMSLEGMSFPFVIKPSVGFFSIGVHIIKNEDDWNVAKKELNYDALQSIYPSDVLNTSTFILEEFIQGEEFAVDYYYNHKGDVEILNIMHHLFSSGSDTSDRVYTTTKDIILKYKDPFRDFLHSIGRKAGLRNFPAHAELRMKSSGHINAIEINPLRFGGWCTTGDLLGVALGFNSYMCYVQNQKPDWQKVFENHADKKYSIVVLNNNSGIAPDAIKYFDYDLLSNDFENPLLIRKIDIAKYSVFGFAFTQTSFENGHELHEILASDLKKYIHTKSNYSG